MTRRPLTEEDRCAWPIEVKGAMSVSRLCRYPREPGNHYCVRHAKLLAELGLKEKQSGGSDT